MIVKFFPQKFFVLTKLFIFKSPNIFLDTFSATVNFKVVSSKVVLNNILTKR